MSQSILEMAKELDLAMVGAGTLPPEDTQDAIRDIHAFLMQLREKEGAGMVPVRPDKGVAAGVVTWKKSITKHAMTCLECRTSLKQLAKHVSQHGLDSDTYRARYGIPRSQPLAAKEMTERRQKTAQQSRFWEKTGTYVKRQRHNATV
jgi:predicted transcriptional regulator